MIVVHAFANVQWRVTEIYDVLIYEGSNIRAMKCCQYS